MKETTITKASTTTPREEFLQRIENVVSSMIYCHNNELVEINCSGIRLIGDVWQAPTIANILILLQYCHKSLVENERSTKKDIWYVFPDVFQTPEQAHECILDACSLLGVTQSDLGIDAEPLSVS